MKKCCSVMKKLVLAVCIISMMLLTCACQVENKPEAETTKDSTTVINTTEATPIPKWKTAYLEYLEVRKDTHLSYALVFIDDDDIPELYLSGVDEATGDSICMYKKGAVVEQNLHRIGGGWYIEKSGSFANRNGHMGQLHTHVFELNEDGFVLTFEALSSERIKDLGNDKCTIYLEYSIWDEATNEADYNAAVDASFDFENAVRLNENAVNYKTIRQQIIDLY